MPVSNKRKPSAVITKVRTGMGDQGFTRVGHEAVHKGSTVVEFLAALDLAQTAAGACLGNETSRFIVSGLFELGAMVHSCYGSRHKSDSGAEEILDRRVEVLECAMAFALHRGELSMPGFLVTSSGDWADIALTRCFVRQAEVLFWRCNNLPSSVVLSGGRFLNTLSDVLFVHDAVTRGKRAYWVGIGEEIKDE